MSDFWAFEGAHMLAIVMIVILAAICLFVARNWGKQL
jgi:hypothetical protein